MSRTRLTWIVVGGVAVLLFVAGVDALRSSDSETAAPPTRASTAATRASTTVVEAVDRLRAEYIAQVDAICTERFFPTLTELEDIAALHEAAARASEEVLTALRALPPPQADRARVNQILVLMEQQTDVLRQLAAAASAGETARVEMLSRERVDLTHQKDGLVFSLASLWGVSPEPLLECPVGLPA